MTNVFMGGEIPPGFTAEPKLNREGKQLYLLPQPDLAVSYTIPKAVKSIVVTDRPVMVYKQVPFTTNGQQASYEVTRPVYEQVPVHDEEENIIGYKDGDVIGQEGTGTFLPLSTMVEVQETNSESELLYWNTVEEQATRYEPQEPLEITDEDEQYTNDLNAIYELVAMPAEPVIAPFPNMEQLVVRLEAESKVVNRSLDTNKEDTAQLNLQMIDIWECLIDGGVV